MYRRLIENVPGAGAMPFLSSYPPGRPPPPPPPLLLLAGGRAGCCSATDGVHRSIHRHNQRGGEWRFRISGRRWQGTVGEDTPAYIRSAMIITHRNIGIRLL